MAAATIEICESNGAGETVSHNITNTNMGSSDAADLNPVSYPVLPGDRTYAKYQRIHCTSLGTSSKIDNLKVWRTGALGGAATHVTNAGTGANYSAKSYATPVSTSIADVDNAMPTSTPASANLGIATSLTGALTAAGYSDYFVHQIITDAADIAGSTSSISYQYDETA